MREDRKAGGEGVAEDLDRCSGVWNGGIRRAAAGCGGEGAFVVVIDLWRVSRQILGSSSGLRTGG